MKYIYGLCFTLCAIACVAPLSKKANTLPLHSSEISIDSLSITVDKEYNPFQAEATTRERQWVDSIYNQMSLEQKIGQLFMVAAYSNKNEAHAASIDSLIINQHIGGVIFFQGGPLRQAKLTNRFQSKAKVPLFVGIDAEWGLAMRLDSTFAYPWNMTLGAVQDLELIKQVGQRVGVHTKRIGAHFNFGPVLDVNTNAQNPIIGNRSFGENPKRVSDHALAFMKGLQSQGVLATGKHFPGHGDTSKDSHHTLPTLNHSLSRMNEVELYPYKKLIKAGLASVMVAHISFPALEPQQGFPSSLSKNIVTDLLQDQLHFKGLIFTDALNMKGASNFKSPGEIDLAAFLAGNDILLFPENVPLAVEVIKSAYEQGQFDEARLAKSVKKILSYKYKAGLSNYQPVELNNLYADLNTPEDHALNYKLYEQAVTVLKNDQMLPIKDLAKAKIAYVKIGEDSDKEFLATLQYYAGVTPVENENLDSLLVQLKEYDKVIIGYHKSNSNAWKKHDFASAELEKLQRIAAEKPVILAVFARPYALLGIDKFEAIQSVILSYQNHPYAKEVTAQIIFGALEAKGRIPVSIRSDFKEHTGLKTKSLDRLGFTKAENVGMSSAKLTQIDEIAKQAIDRKVAPGMQILVARGGKIVYLKSFGHHTYEQHLPVKENDLYDVASLTKILATLPMVAKDLDTHELKLDDTLGELLPEFASTDKANINLKEILTHNSGLYPWIPFYKATLDSISKKPDSLYYSNTWSEDFPTQVANNLYLKKGYTSAILAQIAASKLGEKKYKYSDFGFIILKEYLERAHHKTLDKLVQEHFYASMGMNRSMYNPLTKFDLSEIIPTEYDTYYRYQLLQGYVHDMAAAMQGGVAGHAGLFANAVDVAKMMQLYLNKGHYGGVDYFSSKTFNKLNTLYYDRKVNRRALGFDKPTGDASGPTCNCVSMESFGHTGFTGTMAWADPKTQTLFVFLSNRTFPDSNAENKLAKEKIRTRIQQVIADAITQ